jgi:4-amino-4-deoxy-L-arabinose transferase-like glycosyltransferase
VPESQAIQTARPHVPLRRAVAALRARLSRQEWLLVGLVLAAYAYFITPAGTNSLSRMDMVQALASGTAIIDRTASNTIDVSIYHGHYYSPRSVGLSLLAVPVWQIATTIEAAFHAWATPTIQIGLLSLFTVLPAALAGVIAFERLLVHLRPELAGTPVPLIVSAAFALGTVYYLFATTFFSHAFAGGLIFTAFYLLYRARSAARPERLLVLAGVLTGLAVVSEYLAAVIALILCAYVWYGFPERRLQRLVLFCAGAAPWALVLGWYNWLAFGDPLHMSYEYVAGSQFAGQHQGLFGITWPRLAAYWEILVYPRGLLVESPVLALVPLGFYRWWRSAARPSAEWLVCAAVTALYPSLVASYFLPMAGENLPAPRLLVPMLPFACVALLWVAADARRWVRGFFALLTVVGIAISFLWVALGVREFHTYGTYPVRELFLPVLVTGYVPHANGDTPPTLATWIFQAPQGLSLYLLLVPLTLWTLHIAWRVAAARLPRGAEEQVAELPPLARSAPTRG